MTPVNAKIGIQGEDLGSHVNFRQPNQASVRQGHRPVAIAMHKRPQVRLFRFDGEPYAYYSPLQEREDGVGFAPLAIQEESCLGEDRLTGQERWAQVRLARGRAGPYRASPRIASPAKALHVLWIIGEVLGQAFH